MLNETGLRVGFFVVFLLSLLALETRFPRKKLKLPRKLRWTNNILLVVLDNVIVKWVLPISTTAVALWAEQNSIGIFHQLELHLNFSTYLSFGLAILILDLVIYGQHVLSHNIPSFWRLHRVHHADLDIDVTTASRFHPIEIVLSIFIKFVAILIFGVSPLAVLSFEIILNASAMFNHANWRLPKAVDVLVRKLIVTPDMHRIHHSVYPQETNSNYGFFLSVWDRIFSTYRETPADGHRDMVIGISEFREDKYSKLKYLLTLPFINDPKQKKQTQAEAEKQTA